MHVENARVVREMTDEEREKHRAEILDQLGPDVASLIRKAQEARNLSSAEGISRVHFCCDIKTDIRHTGIVQPVPNRPHATSSEVSLFIIMIPNQI